MSATSTTNDAASNKNGNTVNINMNWRSYLSRILIQIAVHVFCIVLYLVPILSPNEFGGPTLDELHIMSPDNKDIHDASTTLTQIFQNDYWGRPMHAENSHKSWRPLTVLTFRYLKGLMWSKQLTCHRLVNIVAHAATAEIVSIVALELWSKSLLIEEDDDGDDDDDDDQQLDESSDENATIAARNRQRTTDETTTQQKQQQRMKRRKIQFITDPANRCLLLRMLVKLVFILHPTHVEVTANCANRPHILAVMCSTLLCCSTTPTWLFMVAIVCGYLVSETFLFQIPPVMVTIVVIAYYNNNYYSTRRQQQNQKQPSLLNVMWQYIVAVVSQLPRIIMLALSILMYYGGRAYFDTLDIPTGLIRPAENPFFPLEGQDRIINYAYVLAIHIAKGIPGCDPIGFSHEYGFDCIPTMENGIYDERFRLVYIVLSMFIGSLFLALFYDPHKYFGIVAIYWSWTLTTLFPVSGFVKVGTFVSDRIVVASTVPVAWSIGRVLYTYFTKSLWSLPARPLQMAVILWCFANSYMTVHNRALQWMDSISLLNSSLETCPRFAKAHMEISKIHSGLYPSLFDLKKSRYHLDIAREIDPDMCDLHQQFAYVAVQEGKYKEYEEELTQAVLCPFTMGGAFPMWQQYWKIAIESTVPGTPQRVEVEQRQTHYAMIIQQAVHQAQEKEAAAEAEKRRR